ncbi:MAG: ABATE domain-containing protein, partial [Acidobacteriota bacterium]
LLSSYGRLVRWSQEAGLLSKQSARRLLRKSLGDPGRAKQALRRALNLRESIYRIFSRLAEGKAPAVKDLNSLNAAAGAALSRLRVVAAPRGFAWDWKRKRRDLDWLLWPVARSAADLLTSENLARVRQCADDRGCGWLFLDRSRNRSRRWCAMDDCGNRAKARRHYERHKKGDGG